jgi:hypothetical protein
MWREPETSARLVVLAAARWLVSVLRRSCLCGGPFHSEVLVSLNPWPKGESHFKRDEPALASQRHTRRKTRKQLLDDAYKEVDSRDGGKCWVTGRMTLKSSPDARNLRERHHLRGRRVKPEWRHDPDRIITVTKEAHDLITLGKIDVEGDDARRPIFFHWNCKPKERPFEILPKRLRHGARRKDG